MSRTPLRVLLSCTLAVLAACGSGRAPTTGSSPQAIAPVAGHLVIVGGGVLGQEITQRFIALAGGPDARIVVIPTAGEDSVYRDTW
ncbi:MAG: cyanophycinase, partial [Gemmatimonadaceae bacterium]